MNAKYSSVSAPISSVDSLATPKSLRRCGEFVPPTQVSDTAGGAVLALVASDGSWLPSEPSRSRAQDAEPPVNQLADPMIAVPDSIRYLGVFIPSFLP